jgi:hypothetical protein
MEIIISFIGTKNIDSESSNWIAKESLGQYQQNESDNNEYIKWFEHQLFKSLCKFE